jgi:hypothetical protein
MKAHAPYQAPIQFRPSEPLERWITTYAGLWNVTDNEAARRLATLGATHLTVDQYPLLATLAGTASRPDFVRACEQVKIAVDAADRTREELGEKPLAHEERIRFIERTIEEAVKSTKSQRRIAQPNNGCK